MQNSVEVDVDTDLATAVGLCVLGDVTLVEAAEEAGVTRWELEDAIESAGLTETLGLEQDADVAADIDSLLDGDA
jgi:copper homeostasis protein CutC